MERPDDLPRPILRLLELLNSKSLVLLSEVVEAGLGDAFWHAWPGGLLDVERTAVGRLEAGLKHVCYRKLPDSLNPVCWLSHAGRHRLELHRLWHTSDLTSSYPVDNKKDTAEKKLSRPRNLKKLQDVARQVRRNKTEQGMTQEESVGEYVEEHYPNLTTEEQIRKRDSLIRSLNRYRHLLKPAR
jgi:hypothetical protein